MRAYVTPSVAIIFRADGVTALIVKQCTDSHSRTIISTRHASLVNTSTKFCAVIIVLVSFFFLHRNVTHARVAFYKLRACEWD